MSRSVQRAKPPAGHSGSSESDANDAAKEAPAIGQIHLEILAQSGHFRHLGKRLVGEGHKLVRNFRNPFAECAPQSFCATTFTADLPSSAFQAD